MNRGGRLASRQSPDAAAGTNSRSELFAKALKLLSARGYSEAELRRKLSAKIPCESELMNECLSRLRDLGYLDDKKFAQGYATHRIALKPAGRSRLARELANKRVDRKIIDEALDLVFEDNAEEGLIDRAIEKRLRIHGPPRGRNEAKRIFDHLCRLGFDYDLILRKLREIRAAGAPAPTDTESR